MRTLYVYQKVYFLQLCKQLQIITLDICCKSWTRLANTIQLWRTYFMIADYMYFLSMYDCRLHVLLVNIRFQTTCTSCQCMIADYIYFLSMYDCRLHVLLVNVSLQTTCTSCQCMIADYMYFLSMYDCRLHVLLVNVWLQTTCTSCQCKYMYSETCLNQTMNKMESCINWTRN